MQTRITRLLNITHPVLCPGMTYVSNAELVAAVSRAGGMGILAVGHLSQAETLAEIRKVRALTDKPFGIGAALMMPGAKENVEIALAEKVPVINFSLGNGTWICERAHAYGGKVIATVVNLKHARAAVRAGVDALLVTGHEAAAHGGAVTSLVLIPGIRQITDLPIIATGGFGTGGGLVAALALGADAVAMGTRFACTRESPLHDNTKNLIVQKGVEDTIYNSHFDGLPCRVMKTPAAEKATARPMSLWKALWKSLQVAHELKRPLLGILREALRQGFAETLKLTFFGAATLQVRKAILDGDMEQGVQLIGQVQGLVQDIPAVEELLRRVMGEAGQAVAHLNQTYAEAPVRALAVGET